MKHLGEFPKCDFSEEFVCLGFLVKVFVYSQHQTIAIAASHHMGKSYGLKLIGDGIEAKSLATVREFIRQWLFEKPEANTEATW